MTTNSFDDNALILVVDDDTMTRMMMRQVLEKQGFRVIEAENGQLAVDAFKLYQPSALVLDVEMPVKDGLSACSEIRQTSNGSFIPILIATSSDDSESIENAYQAGATDFIAKPINWTMFGHRMRYILRASKAISDYQHAEMRASRLGRVVENSSNEIFIINSDTFLILEANNNARNNLKISNQTLSQYTLTNFLVDMSKSEFSAQVKPLLDEIRDEVVINVRIQRNDGSFYQIEMRVHLFDQESKDQLVVIAQDITDRTMAEERMRHLAFHDTLTGLPNRQLFTEKLDMMIKLSQRSETLVAVMFIDLDNFKRINDTLGHSIGDLLLKQVAEKLKACVRESDYIARSVGDQFEMMAARLGGDEFTIVLNHIKEKEGAVIVAKRILASLGGKVNLEGHDVIVTPSIGIAFAPFDAQHADSLIKYADTAMYHAKKNGKNNFQCYCHLDETEGHRAVSC